MLLPGEREARRKADAEKWGIPYEKSQWETLHRISNMSNTHMHTLCTVIGLAGLLASRGGPIARPGRLSAPAAAAAAPCAPPRAQARAAANPQSPPIPETAARPAPTAETP